MMIDAKKYTVAFKKVPNSERIIFKLICSVSARTKGRDKYYELVPDNQLENADLMIRGDEDRISGGDAKAAVYHVEINNNENVTENVNNQTLSKPLIATRVLAALDDLVNNANISFDVKESKNAFNVDDVSESLKNNEIEVSDKADTLSFDISEEEASELAIVHDESLTNPANKDDDLSDVGSAQVTPIRVNRSHTADFKEAVGILSEAPVGEREPAETQRALVVDDSPSVRKQLELELELFDVEVDYAATAKEAFDSLELEKYDVAFLDVVLPDKDGFSICRHIKETSQETKVIMLTGKAKQADKVKGALAGCDAYMVKPVGRMTFQSTVRNFLTLVDSSTVVEA